MIQKLQMPVTSSLEGSKKILQDKQIRDLIQKLNEVIDSINATT